MIAREASNAFNTLIEQNYAQALMWALSLQHIDTLVEFALIA